MYDDAKGMEEIYESLEKVYDWTSEGRMTWYELKYVKWIIRNLLINR